MTTAVTQAMTEDLKATPIRAGLAQRRTESMHVETGKVKSLPISSLPPIIGRPAGKRNGTEVI